MWAFSRMEDLVGLFSSQFTLTEEEKKEFILVRNSETTNCTKHLLVGQVLSLKPICRGGLLKIFKGVWKDDGLRIGGLGDGRLLFEVSTDAIKNRILRGGPWSFDKSLMVLADANGKGSPTKIPLSIENFWVQIHGLDPEDMTREVGQLAGGCLGQYRWTDLGDKGVCLTNYLRIRVGINVLKPLLCAIKLRINDKARFYKVRYERLPNFCYICGHLNHVFEDCNKRDCTLSLAQQQQFGDFLRADTEGPIFSVRQQLRFFEPMKPAWSVCAPEFVDSVAGFTRSRVEFEQEPTNNYFSATDTSRGVNPVREIGEPVSSSSHKRRRIGEKESEKLKEPHGSNMEICNLNPGMGSVIDSREFAVVENRPHVTSNLSPLVCRSATNEIVGNKKLEDESTGINNVGTGALCGLGTLEVGPVDLSSTCQHGSLDKAEMNGEDCTYGPIPKPPLSKIITRHIGVPSKSSMDLIASSSPGPLAKNSIGVAVNGPCNARILQKWKNRARLACAPHLALQSSPNLQSDIAKAGCSSSNNDPPAVLVAQTGNLPPSTMDISTVTNNEANAADTVMGSGPRTHHEQC